MAPSKDPGAAPVPGSMAEFEPQSEPAAGERGGAVLLTDLARGIKQMAGAVVAIDQYLDRLLAQKATLLAAAVEAEDWFAHQGDAADPAVATLVTLLRDAIAKAEVRP